MFRTATSRPSLAFCRTNTLATIQSVSSARTELFRMIGNDTRARAGVLGRRVGGPRTTIKEKLSEPTTGLPFAVGRGVVLGASALGMGALCFYGAGMGSEAGAFERSL